MISTYYALSAIDSHERGRQWHARAEYAMRQKDYKNAEYCLDCADKYFEECNRLYTLATKASDSLNSPSPIGTYEDVRN